MKARILLAKTALDGHWRGVSAVAHALRDGGFEVVLAGMAEASQIVQMAIQEDVDLVGLNVGGRIEVVERIVAALRSELPDIPIFAGGTLPPPAVRRLVELGIRGFPPGSSLADIVVAAEELTAAKRNANAHAGSTRPW
jgi:methylmalonyl-CoA mutase C-terminal domain/subunit